MRSQDEVADMMLDEADDEEEEVEPVVPVVGSFKDVSWPM